jgi:hypothetical protein
MPVEVSALVTPWLFPEFFIDDSANANAGTRPAFVQPMYVLRGLNA